MKRKAKRTIRPQWAGTEEAGPAPRAAVRRVAAMTDAELLACLEASPFHNPMGTLKAACDDIRHRNP